jgi:F-type H+-transporting ATPase subunit epsilon
MVEARGQLRCVVVSPERALLDTAADFIVVPLYDGELGVLPGRAPLIGRLGFGELRIKQGSATQHIYVDGGFVQVRSNTVTVLTSRAQKAEEIDTAAANNVLHQPVTAGATATADARAKAQDRARAQLRVARHRTATA